MINICNTRGSKGEGACKGGLGSKGGGGEGESERFLSTSTPPLQPFAVRLNGPMTPSHSSN